MSTTEAAELEEHVQEGEVDQLMTANSEKEEPEKVRCFGRWVIPNGDLLTYWADNTTISGVKYIAEDTDIQFRRWIWLVLTALSTAFFCRYVADRVIYYNSNPVSVNIEINDNGSLPFPAVTICKQNAFTMSKAVKSSLYRGLQLAYGEGHFNESRFEKEHAWILDVSMEKIFNETVFDLEDFILECKWHDRPCSHKNFTYLRTGGGMCVTFNIEGLMVTGTGVGNGLRLLLNLETYEYMTTPFEDSAGLRVHIHPHTGFPFVHEKGLAVAAGTHTFLGTRMLQSETLQPPYGKCGSAETLFPGRYSERNCEALCFARYIYDQCKCRQFYVPEIPALVRNGSIPVCTLRQELSCVKPKLKFISRQQEQACNMCTMGCTEENFHSQMSFSDISKLTKDDMHHRPKEFLMKLHSRHKEAHDLRNLMEVDRILKGEGILDQHLAAYETLRKFNQEAIPNLKKLLKSVQEELKDAEDMYNLKMQLLEEQETAIQNYYMQPLQVLTDAMFNGVAHELFEFSYKWQQAAKQLSIMDKSHTMVRRAMNVLILLRIQMKQLAVSNTIQNLPILVKCFTSATLCPEVVLEANETWASVAATIPKTALRTALEGVEGLLPEVMDNLNAFSTTLGEISQLVGRVYSQGQFDTVSVAAAETKYFNQGKLWLNHYTLIRLRFLNVLEIVRAKKKKFREDSDYLKLSYSCIIDGNIEELSLLSNQTHVEDMVHLDAFYGYVRDFVNFRRTNPGYLPSFELRLKSNLVEKFMAVSNVTQEFRMHFLSTRRHLVNVNMVAERCYKMLQEYHVRLWYDIVNDKDAWEQYKLRGLQDRFITPVPAQQENEIRKRYHIKLQTLADNMKDKYPSVSIIKDMHRYEADLFNYQKQNNIDGVFCSTNFLRMSIFYRKLNVKRVEQQIAYDWSSLISDIGGTMGLFVGASALSFAEIVDILHCLMWRLWDKRKTKK